MHFLLEALGEPGRAWLGRTLRAAIGPVTAEALSAAGLPAHVQPTHYTAEALAETLAGAFEGDRPASPAPA